MSPSAAAARAARGRTRVSGNPWITPRLFRFLRELKANNEREWFQENKQRYHDEVRDPLLAFVEAIAPGIHELSPHLLADPSPVGGALFRIYRDTRFSKDKTPYKTHAGLHFRHAGDGDVHGPGLYLHLEPGSVFTAAGIWHPDSGSLKRIRSSIAEHPARWKAAQRGIAIDDGEALKRPPRGFDPEHPLVADLKRKSFTSSEPFTQRDACAADFPRKTLRAWRKRTALLRFLSGAAGLDY